MALFSVANICVHFKLEPLVICLYLFQSVVISTWHVLAKLLLGCNLGSVAGYSLFCSSHMNH